jgi:hypothetical protein
MQCERERTGDAAGPRVHAFRDERRDETYLLLLQRLEVREDVGGAGAE